MGRAQRRMGPRDMLADELRWYFQESESDLGLASSFGAVIDAGMAGFLVGGRSNGAERKMEAIADRPGRPAKRHRLWRDRLRLLGERQPRMLEVLWAAYGPTDWSRVADKAFGTGSGERMMVRLGNIPGVALLTAALAKAGHQATGTQAGALLAALVATGYPNAIPPRKLRAAQAAAQKLVECISEEATALLSAAMTELAPQPAERPQVPRRRVPPLEARRLRRKRIDAADERARMRPTLVPSWS